MASYETYDWVLNFTGVAASGGTSKNTFQNLDGDFLVDDIRIIAQMNATVATIGMVGAPFAIDGVGAVDNSKIPYLNQIRAQFQSGSLKWSNEPVSAVLLSGDGRRPGYPPVPRAVGQNDNLQCEVTNNSAQVADIQVVLRGRIRRT